VAAVWVMGHLSRCRLGSVATVIVPPDPVVMLLSAALLVPPPPVPFTRTAPAVAFVVGSRRPGSW
jgi:hypothetical protein